MGKGKSHTIGGNLEADTQRWAWETVFTCGTMMVWAPESRQREIHSAEQVGTTTAGEILCREHFCQL